MNKNQKIAVGCGVAGCLGLILLVLIAVVLGVLGYVAVPGTSTNRNYNYNRSSNYNGNVNLDSNSNSNTDSSSASSTMSDDEKHRLFQAAGITRDNQLIMKVLVKIGFPTGSGTEFSEFTNEHIRWAMNNTQFIQSVITAEKARAYVEAHIDD